MNRVEICARLRRNGAVAGRAIGSVALGGLVAACGGSPVIPAAHRSATPTPAVATSAAPTAAPTAAPAAPVVMIEQNQSSATNAQYVLQAMDPAGTPLWAVPVGNTGAQTIYTAGPRLFEVDSQAKTVSVFDRTGHPLGDGDGPGEVFSASSAEWAWSSSDAVSPSPAPNGTPVTVTGSFWVAGIGEAPHRVYRWTEADQAGSIGEAFDRLAEWSDQGLVSSEFAPWVGCAEGHQASSFIVNPATGVRTDLGSDPVVDVHAGVIVTAPRTASGPTAQSIVLSGATSFTWTEPAPGTEIPNGVFVSPAGTHVAIPLFNIGCAGEQPRFRTAIIGVSDHSVRYLPNVFADGWLDDDHLIAEVSLDYSKPNQELDIVALGGTQTLLGHGRLIGVLTAS